METMATENSVKSKNAIAKDNEEAMELPFDGNIDSLLAGNCDTPAVGFLVDFDVLLLAEATKGVDIEKGENMETDSAQKLVVCSEDTRKTEDTSADSDSSFLDLLDDLFPNDQSMDVSNEMASEQLGQLAKELWQSKFASSSGQKTREINQDDKHFLRPKIYSCYYCPKKFYNRISSHHHQVCHTKKLLRCQLCGERTRSNSALRRHIQYHHRYTPRMVQVFFDSR